MPANSRLTTSMRMSLILISRAVHAAGVPGVVGMSTVRVPAAPAAAFMKAVGAPTQPNPPAPFAPMGLFPVEMLARCISVARLAERYEVL